MTIEQDGVGEPGTPSHVPTPVHMRTGTVWADALDAISLRSFLLVIGTLGLGIGFVLSYDGALHSPTLQNLPVTIVSQSRQATQQVVGQIGALPGGMLTPSGGTDVAAAVQKVFTSVDQKQGRTLTVNDVVPAGSRDFDGLSAFYLVVGWCVTGYLIASILGISAGTRPATITRAVIRLVTVALCGFVAALVGTLIVQRHELGALGGAFWPIVATGTLLILGVGAITMALEIAFGVIGIGLAVLLVVVLGNPSAGGAFPRSMLPPFWRAIGAFLPPGAGTGSVRSIAYFGGAQTGYPLLILGAYAALGILLSMLLCALKPRPKSG